ncbi:hypothetical protein GOP47_0010607 [Adiantum capillus-veneris]|uniref:Uncharacterized protein n=1 Tax=Adiantum capillus-veneris TaxID=13818 RepID=A0A9D4UVB9_ADICA|nr:hypothetical protein GOP47_0010607 [Adiantum capillus-veneris]
MWRQSVDMRSACRRWRADTHAAESNGYANPWPAWTSVRPPASYCPQNLTYLVEAFIEKVIFNCRFFTLLAVIGSLSGSMLCFFQGWRFVTESFLEYIHAILHGIDSGHVVILLVEAMDVFLVATVLLIFGMGIYELLVNTIGLQKGDDNLPSHYTGSNFFGLFRLEKRPLWLEIRSLHELKTKVGHVIVMILLVGMFEKSKMVPIDTGFDLLCFSASIFTSAGCLFLLSKLHVK